MAEHLPTALTVMGELLSSADERIRLAAASEVFDRVIGKPKPIDDGTLEDKLRVIFGRLKERLKDSDYVIVLEAIANSAD